MAGFTASWVHGNAVVAERPPVGDVGLVHYGWGAQIRILPGTSRWFHVALPTPVMLDGYRMKLIRAFIQWRQTAGYPRSGRIYDLHLYDGQQKVAAQSGGDFKEQPTVSISGHRTYELYRPRVWEFGAGLSFNVGAIEYADGNFIDSSQAPVMVIGAAGADFEVS